MKKFQNYDYIWLEDKNLYLNKMLTEEDPENDSEDEPSEELEMLNTINLRKFRMQVSSLIFYRIHGDRITRKGCLLLQ